MPANPYSRNEWWFYKDDLGKEYGPYPTYTEAILDLLVRIDLSIQVGTNSSDDSPRKLPGDSGHMSQMRKQSKKPVFNNLSTMVFLPPDLFEAAKQQGYNMMYFRKTELIPGEKDGSSYLKTHDVHGNGRGRSSAINMLPPERRRYPRR